MKYQKMYLETKILVERLKEMGSLGLKSIMYAGEGEPFLHKDMADIINCTSASGIDAAITTNGVLMKAEVAEKILGVTEWIKVSCNAGTAETYSKIHRAKQRDFQNVFKNLNSAVKIKQINGYACILGLQIVLLPENECEIVGLAKMCKDIGLDYIVVKPYSQHLQGYSRKYENIQYAKYMALSEKLEELATDEFSTIFRMYAMHKWDQKIRNYKKCFSLPFWSYLDAAGNIWGCSMYLNDERFLYGNIYEKSFQEIWEGEKRCRSLRWTEKEYNPGQCRINCRMDNVNQYLWHLKNPPEHVNFI
jgi:radical SAM protein with 4Fe4S-binding SPASM domain